MSIKPELNAVLNEAVKSHIPGGFLEQMTIGDSSTLTLALLNVDFPQHTLDAANVQRLMNEPMYWVFCWASGQVLANHILAQPELTKSKTVCDFGCGCGVVAIAAAKAGARKVYACDIDPLARQAAQLNASLNDVELHIISSLEELDDKADVITVADVLYDQDNLPLLDQFLAYANQVLLADSRIKHFKHVNYNLLCEAQSHTLPDLDESAEFRSVRIYQGQLNRANV